MPVLSVAAPGISRLASGRTPLPATDDTQLQNTVSSILGLNEKAATDAAGATAAGAQYTGAEAEVGAYGQVETIAGNNAAIAQVSGDVTELQQKQQLLATTGAQRATTASNGFGESGSNLDILRSSFQQGALTQQLGETQTALNVGGYLAQGVAAHAEGVGAQAAADSALALKGSYTVANALDVANGANETAALKGFIGSRSLTPDQKLILNPLSTDPNSPTYLDVNSLTQPAGSTLARKNSIGGGGPPPEAYDANGALLPGFSSTYTGIGTSGYGTKIIGNKF